MKINRLHFIHLKRSFHCFFLMVLGFELALNVFIQVMVEYLIIFIDSIAYLFQYFLLVAKLFYIIDQLYLLFK